MESVPSQLHIFPWLLAKNKVLTRDNLAKRKKLDDMSCLFCTDPENVSHLFFDCCVARVTWENVSEVCKKKLGTDFELVANMWLHDKKFKAINICTTTTLWAIWKFKNEICFQGTRWRCASEEDRKHALGLEAADQGGTESHTTGRRKSSRRRQPNVRVTGPEWVGP
jgi:hypothetical protein